MRKSTLIPVRIKGSSDAAIGDEQNSVSNYDSGYTKAIVYATAESVLNCSVVRQSDRRVLAHCIDESLLEFDSYREEFESELGRAAYQIALEEGVEAYKELKEEIPTNVYLHAAVHRIPVRDAAEDLDATKIPLLLSTRRLTRVLNGILKELVSFSRSKGSRR